MCQKSGLFGQNGTVLNSLIGRVLQCGEGVVAFLVGVEDARDDDLCADLGEVVGELHLFRGLEFDALLAAGGRVRDEAGVVVLVGLLVVVVGEGAFNCV